MKMKIIDIKVEFGYNATIKFTADSERIYVESNNIKTLTTYSLSSAKGSWINNSYGIKCAVSEVLSNYDYSYTICVKTNEGLDDQMFFSPHGKRSVEYLIGDFLQNLSCTYKETK